jgi:hypothetical protein
MTFTLTSKATKAKGATSVRAFACFSGGLN